MKYKIAVATSDGKTVDTHFGHADSFLILEVDEADGSFEDVETRGVPPACSPSGAGSAQCGSSGCGSPLSDDPMDGIARSLSDVDYVLVARIGPHALRALAKYGVTAYDIVLPVEEAVGKIHAYRQKVIERRQRQNGNCKE